MLDRTGDAAAYLIHSRPKFDRILACSGSTTLDAIMKGARRLARAAGRLKPISSKRYDFCNTPPALRVPTLNALALSDFEGDHPESEPSSSRPSG